MCAGRKVRHRLPDYVLCVRTSCNHRLPYIRGSHGFRLSAEPPDLYYSQPP